MLMCGKTAIYLQVEVTSTYPVGFMCFIMALTVLIWCQFDCLLLIGLAGLNFSVVDQVGLKTYLGLDLKEAATDFPLYGVYIVQTWSYD